MRSRSVLKGRLARGLLACLAAVYIRLVRATSRFDLAGPGAERFLADNAAGTPFVMAFWHGRILMMSRIVKDRRVLARAHVLISHHGDGEVIAGAIERLGLRTVRGSPKRGAVGAVIALNEVIRAGGIAVFTPDGPRGPRMRASPGVAAVARFTGAAIYPTTFSVRRGRLARSWDRFLVAYPFTRGVYMVGEPLTVPPDADDAAQEAARAVVEDRLNALTAEADRLMGREPVAPAPPGTHRRRG